MNDILVNGRSAKEVVEQLSLKDISDLILTYCKPSAHTVATNIKGININFLYESYGDFADEIITHDVFAAAVQYNNGIGKETWMPLYFENQNNILVVHF